MIDRALAKIKRWVGAAEEGVQGHNAMVMSGGGARAAYQVGVVKYISEAFPGAQFPIMTGVSAGAINTIGLANHVGTFGEAASRLVAAWRELNPEKVIKPESTISLFRRLWSNGGATEHYDTTSSTRRSLLDASPLGDFLMEQLGIPESGDLVGIADNIASGRLIACAILTTSYTTGQSFSWVQGADIDSWSRPNRVAVRTQLNIRHVLASSALPLIFPAVRIGDAWYGDGGVRLTMPLSTAMNLGADRILVVSTRYPRSRREADEHLVPGYPPAAQVIGILMNAIFLDAIDQDAQITELINDLIKELPEKKRKGMKPVRLLTLRPSLDIGRLAGEFQMNFAGALGWLTTGLGSSETKSPDWLSMLLFQHDYISRLMEVGYDDARRQHARIEAFLS